MNSSQNNIYFLCIICFWPVCIFAVDIVMLLTTPRRMSTCLLNVNMAVALLSNISINKIIWCVHKNIL